MTQRSLDDVLASAARLQRLVPDAVLVGGTAAAWYPLHRESHDHDHVLADLPDRFDTVLDARWHDWSAVVSVCTAVAQNMLDAAGENP